MRPWNVVREWSKTMFDRLNLCEITWDDDDEIQREICFSAPPKVSVIVPCPYFNAGNCNHTRCHEKGQFSLPYICPFCYALGAGRQDHLIFKCNSKQAYNSAPKAQSAAKAKSGRPTKKLMCGPPLTTWSDRREGGWE